MSIQMRTHCDRYLDRRWRLVRRPLSPLIARQSGYCGKCLGLAEAADFEGVWWHVVPQNAVECEQRVDASDYLHGPNEPAFAFFVPDPSIQNSVAAAIRDQDIPSVHSQRISLAKNAHGMTCDCMVCVLMRDPARQTGTIGEIFVTSPEYQAIKEKMFSDAKYLADHTIFAHPVGCDCRSCDRGH